MILANTHCRDPNNAMLCCLSAHRLISQLLYSLSCYLPSRENDKMSPKSMLSCDTSAGHHPMHRLMLCLPHRKCRVKVTGSKVVSSSHKISCKSNRINSCCVRLRQSIVSKSQDRPRLCLPHKKCCVTGSTKIVSASQKVWCQSHRID